MMEIGLAIVIASLLESSTAFVYYVSPIDSNGVSCNIDLVLSPCYSLQQLSVDDQVLFNTSFVTLYLLPGRHLIPENQTFLLADKIEVNVSPWRLLGDDVVIECLSKAKILAHNVHKLFVNSVNFLQCSIFLTGDITNFKSTIIVTRCAFSDSKDYAIVSVKNRSTHIEFNISIDQSYFLSNNGAIACNPGPGSLPKINTILNITNTEFLNNQGSKETTIFAADTDLEIQNCVFANNIVAP